MATSSLNLNNISVDSSGRVSFSGLGSGIDYKTTVDSIIAAKRIPIDTLDTRIKDNEKQIAAYQDLRGLLNAFKDALGSLRGAVALGNVGNAFQAKQAFASVSRTDGLAPTAAANLVGVTVDNSATVGSHTIEVLRTATAHKIGTGAFSSVTGNIGTARGGASGSIAGSFDINGVTINVLATDTLQDLRDRINNANTGTGATGVSASIVSVGASQNYLVLTADKAGAPIAIGNETGGVLSSLGLSADGGVSFLNQLQAPQTAQLYADGLLDSSKYRSAAVASSSAAFSSYSGVTAGAHTFEIHDASGALLQTVNYSDTDSLQSLAAAITAGAGGLTASVVSDGGQYRLSIVKNDGTAISVANDSDNLLSTLSFTKQPLLIERATNTINDLFGGITLSLYGAEPGSTIKLDIDRNLTEVKSAVTSVVDGYNAIRKFINEQNQTDSSTGAKSADAGPLFGSRTLATISSTLSGILGSGTQGVSKSFSVLAQIGVSFVDNNTLQDPLLKDTLQVDSQKLDEVLLSNPDDVRKLFAFDFSSSDPRVALLSFTGSSTPSGSGYTLDLTHDGTKLTGATINGVPASTTVDGNTITVTDATGANGLKLYYSGDADASGINLNFTTGMASELFFGIDSMLDATTGSVQGEIDSLTDQNTASQTRIDDMTQRLDYQREQLTNRFIAMETALSTMQSILDNIKQTTDAWSKDN